MAVMAYLPEVTLARWNALLARVRRSVPFYRERLGSDRPLESLEQVTELPFTEKTDFRDQYPFGMFAVPPEQVIRLHMSSGTTGRPVVTGYTRGDLALWAECMRRVLRYCTVNETDVLQNAYGYGLFTGGLGFHLGAESLGCTVIPTSSGVTARQAMLIRDFGTTVLTCTPSYALVLAEALRREGGGPTRLRAGIFGAEPWTEAMRGQIEAALGLRAYDVYGLTELGGPGVAIECSRQDGLHIFEDHFYPEVIDPVSGRGLPAGTPGELVLTSLRREASPVIRYRTRDRTVLDDTPCPCGSRFRRMRKITGRTDDMLIIRGENVFPSQIEEVLLGIPGLTGNYQLVVDRGQSRLDSLEVLVEHAPGIDEDEHSHPLLRLRAEAEVRERLGLNVSVLVLPPFSLPRSEGKAVRIIDRRQQ